MDGPFKLALKSGSHAELAVSRQANSAYLAADAVPRTDAGRKLLHECMRALVVRPSSVSRSSAGAVRTSAFIWLTAWVRAITAEFLALLSMRIISTSPLPDLGVASATPATLRGCHLCISGITLPLADGDFGQVD